MRKSSPDQSGTFVWLGSAVQMFGVEYRRTEEKGCSISGGFFLGTAGELVWDRWMCGENEEAKENFRERISMFTIWN